MKLKICSFVINNLLMKQNKFIWADLSSYNPTETQQFYEAVFGWNYYDDYGYSVAYKEDKQVVGLYQTPQKFQEIKMPSFWMSYIQVNNVSETVAKAKELGGIVELVDLENSIGAIALIRDTLGAGFTIYEGNELDSRTISEENTLIYNELHVSDVQKAISFYQELFNWKFVWVDDYLVDVYCKTSEEKITSIYQIDNEIKSKYEYWVCTFGVKNLQSSVDKVKSLEGIVIFEKENRVLCSDGSEAFFYIREV